MKKIIIISLTIIIVLGLIIGGFFIYYQRTKNLSSSSSVSKSEKKTRIVYFTFIINVHDFVNLEDSKNTIERAISIYDKYNVTGEFYLTSTMWEKFKENYPEVIELLKNKATVSYHIRPPHPVYIGFETPLKGLSQDQLINKLKEYETHSLDLESGGYQEKEGGYALMKKDLGYAPIAGGILSSDQNIQEAEVDVLKEMGLKMIVIHKDGSLSEKGAKKYDLWIRPADFEILEDASGNAWWNTEANPVELFGDKINNLGNEEYFGVSLIHDDNFYRKNNPFRYIYYEKGQNDHPKLPPYDLSEGNKGTKERDIETQDSIWSRYEQLVKAVSQDPQVKVVTSKEIVGILKHY